MEKHKKLWRKTEYVFFVFSSFFVFYFLSPKTSGFCLVFQFQWSYHSLSACICCRLASDIFIQSFIPALFCAASCVAELVNSCRSRASWREAASWSYREALLRSPLTPKKFNKPFQSSLPISEVWGGKRAASIWSRLKRVTWRETLVRHAPSGTNSFPSSVGLCTSRGMKMIFGSFLVAILLFTSHASNACCSVAMNALFRIGDAEVCVEFFEWLSAQSGSQPGAWHSSTYSSYAVVHHLDLRLVTPPGPPPGTPPGPRHFLWCTSFCTYDSAWALRALSTTWQARRCVTASVVPCLRKKPATFCNCMLSNYCMNCIRGYSVSLIWALPSYKNTPCEHNPSPHPNQPQSLRANVAQFGPDPEEAHGGGGRQDLIWSRCALARHWSWWGHLWQDTGGLHRALGTVGLLH